MTSGKSGAPIAILAGGGSLPPLVAAAAERAGRTPVIFAIAGEAGAASFPGAGVHSLKWGEIGRMFRLAAEARCAEAVLVGNITRRPDFTNVRPDLGAVKLIPRILNLMRKSDNALLVGVAEIFEENGLRVVSALDVAPDLVLKEGRLTGSVTDMSLRDVETAAGAAREAGRRDIAQAAVAVVGRVIAVEDAKGTEALLDSVAALRNEGRIEGSGGVLVKCMKPGQDRRLDVPTIGPATAEQAKRAGLTGVAAEAGGTLLVGRDETIEAFRAAGVFLLGIKPGPANG
jgi:UDP-2,3-diacylglucosamine hydrolase